MTITVSKGAGLRPETLGTFPHQGEEEVQFTIACFFMKSRTNGGQEINNMIIYIPSIMCF